jgi:FAD/FMN-containing dehydrogenase
MKKLSISKAVSLSLLLVVCLYVYFAHNTSDQDPYLITDYSRLHPVKVERVVRGKEEAQLIALVKEARENNLKLSIAGQRHSQGGHTYYKDGIVVDMTPFHKILSFDSAQKTIRVQTGATWKDIQDYINPYGLSVKTMQSQNIFTVGGSISINAHGRDIRNGSLIKSVESFRLLMADGQVKQVSRTENAELFPLALGGFGLFGILLDVTLSLTDDEVYAVSLADTNIESYSEYFINTVLTDPDIRMHIARISVAPDNFLTDMYALNYSVDRTVELGNHNKLAIREKGVGISKLLFNLNRTFDWGKNAFWKLQHYHFSNQDVQGRISRNNAMRSESTFMEYRAAGRNDLLQEYFVPVKEFAGFMKNLRELMLEEKDLDLLNITVRYVNEDKEAVLSYANEDMFALVFLFNMPLSDKGQARSKESIERILDLLISHKGTYYLPYAPFPTVEQFRTVYPHYKQFLDKKLMYDPEQLFINYFYEQYIGEAASK